MPSGSSKAEMVPARVLATDSALELIAQLRSKYGGLVFHQSGGCCDGSAPMCYPIGDYLLAPDDVKLGEIGGVGFHMSHSQFAYWKHTQLIIDVVSGFGGMFSLDNGTGKRFLTRSRMFTDAEVEALNLS